MIAFVINPGSRTLKLACAHISEHSSSFGKFEIQLERTEVPLPDEWHANMLPALVEQLWETTVTWPKPDAVVGRGSQMGRVPAGTYCVTPELSEHVLAWQHQQNNTDDFVINLGGPLALMLAEKFDVPAFMVDPTSVDEMLPEAQATGMPHVHREANFHTLNSFVVARRAAYEVGKKLSEAQVVVAHLGVSSSVTAFEKGRAIDTTGTAPDGGPMGMRQAGRISARAFSALLKQYEEAKALHLIKHQSGLLALTNSEHLTELEQRISDDVVVQSVMRTFVHQTCKAMGEQVGALSERPDVLALTGSIAKWNGLMDQIESRLTWIAPVIVVPGELELEALAEGVGRVMLGIEGLREWLPTGVITHPPQQLLSKQAPV